MSPRAPILGSGGAALTGNGQMVSVGVEGSRIKDQASLSATLLAAGATAGEVGTAFKARRPTRPISNRCSP